MREQGKFRWLGISTNLPHVAHFYNWDVFDSFMLPYSLFQRQHEDWITKLSDSGTGTIIRSGAARGEPDHEDSVAYLQGVLLRPETRWRYFESLDLDSLRDPGESRVAFILRYCLAHPGIDTVINGTINHDELRENVSHGGTRPAASGRRRRGQPPREHRRHGADEDPERHAGPSDGRLK